MYLTLLATVLLWTAPGYARESMPVAFSQALKKCVTLTARRYFGTAQGREQAFLESQIGECLRQDGFAVGEDDLKPKKPAAAPMAAAEMFGPPQAEVMGPPMDVVGPPYRRASVMAEGIPEELPGELETLLGEGGSDDKPL